MAINRLDGGFSSGERLRLVVLLEGEIECLGSCAVVCSSSRYPLQEVWLSCGSLLDLLESIALALSRGAVLLAVGGLNGRVFRSLPASPDILVDVAVSDIKLDPGVRVVLQPCAQKALREVRELAQYASRVDVRPRVKAVQAILSRELRASWLFDRGLRVLKPVITPPILLQGVKQRSQRGEEGE